MSGAWGSGSWGSGAWGGAPDFALAFVSVQPVRENVLRVEFDEQVFFTGLLELADASRPDKWSVTPVAGSIGASGDESRPVTVIQVTLAGADDGVSAEDFGRFVDLVLDRPMTPYPAQYQVAWTDVFDSSGATATSGSALTFAAYRELVPPTIDAPRPARDFSNPQDSRSGPARPVATVSLGTFNYGSDGDYAFDEGTASLQKRVIRRLVTKKGAFAHLPNYGVGIPQHAKRLGIASVLSTLAADAEVQISQEPDVAQVKVTAVLDQKKPGLVYFRVSVRPKVGKPVQFDVPFLQAA